MGGLPLTVAISLGAALKLMFMLMLMLVKQRPCPQYTTMPLASASRVSGWPWALV